jgi:uroporphyrin-III C-methyltransferase/precorrin-2 dehydrogenase/sirohydrochlorin ferrochelatase
MNRLSRLPLFFALDGKRAVVAGGSAAAAWKAELLSAAGAEVAVYATEISNEMQQVAANPPQGRVSIRRKEWMNDDFARAAIAVGAFETDEAAAAFAAAARAAGVPVNIVDKPVHCDFAFGSIVNRSPLVIGISTDGAAPMFAQAIRSKFEALLPKGFAAWVTAAARWRGRIKASELSFAARRAVWQRFTLHALKNPDHVPMESDLEQFVAEVRGLGAASENGSVALVGAGPGDPELLTLRAMRALQTADVILFDHLVSREVLEYARREAKKMLVGKTGYGTACRQNDINTLMVNLARSGRRVVRLKGGDPLIFGRAAEEIAACKAAGITVEIVPGITAAQGAASVLGVPLTDRHRAGRLQLLTGHGKGGTLPCDLDWASLADRATTTAIYMPARTLADLVAKAIKRGLDPETPAIAIARATRPDQSVLAGRIGNLPARLTQAAPAGPVLVMIGEVFSGKNATKDEEVMIGAEERRIA